MDAFETLDEVTFRCHNRQDFVQIVVKFLSMYEEDVSAPPQANGAREYTTKNR